MSFTFEEKIGIINLLQTERQNIYILRQLAKSVTKNVTGIATEQEALDIIFTHIPNCVTLLNKRAITREVLFKYLHKNNVAITEDFTKASLINKVMEYWHNMFKSCKNQEEGTNINTATSHLQNLTNGQVAENTSPLQNSEEVTATSTSASSCSIEEASEFPIHLLARQFSEWFFKNYNKNTLKLNDFWSDARLLLRITANDGIDENVSEDSCSLLENLLGTRQRFGFFFNPNLTHAGVQGRMDVHGLVLVLACGTLHTENDCVGVFECAFGLLRDPFAENNWKTKTIQLMLRSKGVPVMPSLEESETLKSALELPVPQGELT